MMGCASSQAALPPGATTTDPENLVDNTNAVGAGASAEVSSDDKYPPAEAFEISLVDVDNDDDDRSDSLIKKHPPKRLQKLVEQAATAVPATTIEHLEEKLAKAEVRRQQYIQQRIENIITLKSKGGNGSADGGADEDDGNGSQDNDLNDGQKDAETAVIVSGNTTTTTSSCSSNSNSSQDADVVLVQATTLPSSSLNETSVSVDKKHVNGDHHHAQVADNDGTHP